jgi:arginine decarboxylase
MLPTPKKFMLTAGTGEGETRLTAFDAALLDAGIGNLNLIKVSSILPPKIQFHEKLEIPPGSLAPTAYGSITSKNSGEIIAVAVAVGIPSIDTYGVIMEYSGKFSQEEIEKRIRNMVIEAFKMRNLPLEEIKVCAVEHKVIHCGSAFAGVVFWY